jgi:hypothetical protein
VTTSDEFAPNSTVTVRQAKRLCAPVNKNNEDPSAPSHPGHETFYTIKQTAPKFDRKKDIPVTVANTFGGQTLPQFNVDLVRAERMLVPTSKSLVGPNFPPPLAVNLDHFKCYRVRGARFRRASVSVQTQFGPALTIDIKRPRNLCVPVDKNGEGIFNDALGLMCFQVRTTPQPQHQVFTNNQFEQGAYETFGVRDLCVPTFVDPGTCGDGEVNAPGEVCDGTDGPCPGRCTAQCTCEPFCGDNAVNQPGEVCDGSAGACPGHCNAQCTCDPFCGDGNFDPQTEDCDGLPPGNGCAPNEVCNDQCTCDCVPACPAGACGDAPDGCNGTIDCGGCQTGFQCVANQCVPDQPQCLEEFSPCNLFGPSQCCPGLECCPPTARGASTGNCCEQPN